MKTLEQVRAQLKHYPVEVEFPNIDKWQHGNTGVCKQQSNTAAKQRDDQALCHQLAHQTAPSRSDGQPDGDFAAAGPCASQQQIGDIRARDDEDQFHQAHQHLDESKQLRSLLDPPLQFCANRRAPVVIRLRILALQG